MRFSLPISLPDMNSYSYSSGPRSNITSSVTFLLTPSCKTFHLSSKSTCIFFRICCSAFIMIYLPPTYLPISSTRWNSLSGGPCLSPFCNTQDSSKVQQYNSQKSLLRITCPFSSYPPPMCFSKTLCCLYPFSYQHSTIDPILLRANWKILFIVL